MGAGEMARAEALLVHALGIAAVAGLATTVLMLTLSDAVFGLLGGRGEPLAQAVSYAHVAFVGSIGVWLLNILSAALRATGNMLAPSAILIAVGLMQVALAGVFGLGAGPIPRLGMPGIALGQVLAYACGTVVLGWYLHSGKARIRLRLRGATWQPALARDLLQLGLKACASPALTISTMMILTWLVARSGPQALAGYGIGTRLEFLLVPLAFSFGAASVPLIGMAIGAGQVARARRVGWTAAAMAGLLLGSAGLVLALVPDLWTDLFTQDLAVLAAADTYFHWAGRSTRCTVPG
jgi:Na+-driven multidrug efflux pump